MHNVDDLSLLADCTHVLATTYLEIFSLTGYNVMNPEQN